MNSKLRKVLCIAASALLLLVTVSGCRDNQGPYIPEDFEGTTRRTQEVVMTTVAAAYRDSGCPVFNPDVSACLGMFHEFLRFLSTEESGLSFDEESVEASFTGYSVELKTPRDGWGNKMRIWVELTAPEAGTYQIFVVSAGSDGEMQILGSYDIINGIETDDVYTVDSGTLPSLN